MIVIIVSPKPSPTREKYCTTQIMVRKIGLSFFNSFEQATKKYRLFGEVT
jgi:hypothetical protein